MVKDLQASVVLGIDGRKKIKKSRLREHQSLVTISLISIASRFFFESIRDDALGALCAMRLDPVERITLARKYDIDAWLIPAYCDLCQQENFITLEDASKIGLPGTVKLAVLRERVRQGVWAVGQWRPAALISTKEPGVAEEESYERRQVRRLVDEAFPSQ